MSSRALGPKESAPKVEATPTSSATTKAEPATSAELPEAVKAIPKTKKDPAPARASVECSSGVKSYVRALLPGSGGSVVRLVIKADAGGGLTATGGDGAEAARDTLKGARADKVKQAAGAALPCHYSYEWSRGG